MPDNFLSDLTDHKKRVGGYMRLVANELFRRACEHDNSKLSSAELDAFVSAFPILQNNEYGSPAYRAGLDKIRPAIEHHYAANDHHPQFFAGGVDDMSLIQIIEMVCDWIASSERKLGNIDRSLEINKERFGIGDQLHGIIENTVRELAGGKKA